MFLVTYFKWLLSQRNFFLTSNDRGPHSFCHVSAAKTGNCLSTEDKMPQQCSLYFTDYKGSKMPNWIYFFIQQQNIMKQQSSM